MNIVEVYGKYNSQLIILISGLSGTGKSKISKNIASKFNLTIMNMENYCKKENDIIVELYNGLKITDWDHVDAYDWDKFNKDIIELNNKKTTNGIIVCGKMFVTDKLKFKPNFHIHINISKKKLVDYRHEFMEKHPEKYPDSDKILNTPNELLIINKIEFPHYIEYMKLSKIDKFVDGNTLNEQQLYEEINNYLIDEIDKFITTNGSQIVEFMNSHSRRGDNDKKDSRNNNDKKYNKNKKDKKHKKKKSEYDDDDSSSSSSSSSSSNSDSSDSSDDIDSDE